MKQIIAKVDINGNGTIDLTEFLIANMDLPKVLNEQRLRAAFSLFDQDGSGTIEVDEIKQVLSANSTVSDEVWRKIMKEADEDGDGQITFAEFSAMMRSLVGNQA